jgi:TonB family protein
MHWRHLYKYTIMLTVLSGAPVFAVAASETTVSPEQESAESDLTALEIEKTVALYRQQLTIYRDQIAAQESLFSTYDPAIGESLTGLASVQLKLGQYQAAIRSYRRAMHIERVNNGIYSLSQEPMIRGLASAYESLEDLESANLNYEQLRYIYARHYQNNSPELVALLNEQSEWHISAYAREPDRQNLYLLGNAYRLMMHALNMASVDSPAGRVTILPLWRNLAVANFLLAEHGRRYSLLDDDRPQFSALARTEPVTLVERLSEDELLVKNSYQSGLVALEAIARYHADNPDSSVVERTEALAELGDWQLSFGKYSSAADAYSQAWQAAEADPSLREALFGEPRLISPPNQDGDPPERSEADDIPFVVASFDVSSRGKPRDIEITESHPTESESLQKTAYKTLKKARFRPRLVEGEMVESTDFRYRLELSP